MKIVRGICGQTEQYQQWRRRNPNAATKAHDGRRPVARPNQFIGGCAADLKDGSCSWHVDHRWEGSNLLCRHAHWRYRPGPGNASRGLSLGVAPGRARHHVSHGSRLVARPTFDPMVRTGVSSALGRRGGAHGGPVWRTRLSNGSVTLMWLERHRSIGSPLAIPNRDHRLDNLGDHAGSVAEILRASSRRQRLWGHRAAYCLFAGSRPPFPSAEMRALRR